MLATLANMSFRLACTERTSVNEGLRTEERMRKSEPDRERLITVPSGHKLAVRLPADLVLRVEALASKNNVDRSTAVRALLERALKGEDQSA
jgi:hypothetical protein